jgi:hypothetical protein
MLTDFGLSGSIEALSEVYNNLLAVVFVAELGHQLHEAITV